jgi:hypothetical protein
LMKTDLDNYIFIEKNKKSLREKLKILIDCTKGI